MFKLFNKDKEKNQDNSNLATKLAALLIHVARIDENYSNKEKGIISKTLIELGEDEKNLENIFIEAEEIEKNSNQILEFTKEIKNKDEAFKIIIVEALWKIIFSDGTSDMYESNLMRRLTGLLYLDNKIVGDIKNKIKNQIENDLPSKR
tara:strand:- start:83 stop:529 length:447 start_codon:yes stop_codon:yes gene_type:complete